MIEKLNGLEINDEETKLSKIILHHQNNEIHLLPF